MTSRLATVGHMAMRGQRRCDTGVESDAYECLVIVIIIIIIIKLTLSARHLLWFCCQVFSADDRVSKPTGRQL